MIEPGLLLRGGHLIDPAEGLDGGGDLRLRDSRVEAVGTDLAADGTRVLDVQHLLVLPGLIDAHVHCFRGLGRFSLTPDEVGVGRSVATVVDAGTSGYSTFPLAHDHYVATARTRVLAYLHLSTLGAVVGPDYSNLADPRLIDPTGIAATVAAYREHLVGLTLSTTNSALGGLGLEPLRRGRKLAEELGLPLLVQIGEAYSESAAQPIDQVLALLRPGDAVTHMGTPRPGGLLDARGRLHPAAREARARGVRFGLGHGSKNFSFAVVRRLLEQDFPPDAVSSDTSEMSVRGPAYDLPTTMAKLLALDLSLRDVVTMATSQAAELIGRGDELGTLAVGRVADVSVLRLEERSWMAVDALGEQMVARRRLTPVLVVRRGEVLYSEPAHGS